MRWHQVAGFPSYGIKNIKVPLNGSLPVFTPSQPPLLKKNKLLKVVEMNCDNGSNHTLSLITGKIRAVVTRNWAAIEAYGMNGFCRNIRQQGLAHIRSATKNRRRTGGVIKEHFREYHVCCLNGVCETFFVIYHKAKSRYSSSLEISITSFIFSSVLKIKLNL